ncbi:phosphotransferase system IIA component [Vibrio ponticus]|nr:phosphotransferase system IIA component [Vibrio ponticus]
MLIEFSAGKIIATPHEIVVKIAGNQMITLQAQTDAIQLIGCGANVVAVNCSEAKWSLKLDNEQQLLELANQIGIAIQ